MFEKKNLKKKKKKISGVKISYGRCSKCYYKVSFQQFKNKILISNSIFNNTNSVNLSSTNLVNIINTNHELNELNITLISSLSKIQFHILIQKSFLFFFFFFFVLVGIPMNGIL